MPLSPYCKAEYLELTAAERWFNRQVDRRRWVVEQGIAHLHSWKVLAIGYRQSLSKADRTLQTVIKLQMYRHHPQAAFE